MQQPTKISRTNHYFDVLWQSLSLLWLLSAERYQEMLWHNVRDRKVSWCYYHRTYWNGLMANLDFWVAVTHVGTHTQDNTLLQLDFSVFTGLSGTMTSIGWDTEIFRATEKWDDLSIIERVGCDALTRRAIERWVDLGINGHIEKLSWLI